VEEGDSGRLLLTQHNIRELVKGAERMRVGGGGGGGGLVSRITPYAVQLFIVFFFSSPCLLKQKKISEEEN
jgi:hypothetical protein